MLKNWGSLEKFLLRSARKRNGLIYPFLKNWGSFEKFLRNRALSGAGT